MDKAKREFYELKTLLFSQSDDLKIYALKNLLDQKEKLTEQEFLTNFTQFEYSASTLYYQLNYALRISQKCANQVLSQALKVILEFRTVSKLLEILDLLDQVEFSNHNLKTYLGLFTLATSETSPISQVKMLAILRRYHDKLPSRFYQTISKNPSVMLTREAIYQMAQSPKEEYNHDFISAIKSKDIKTRAYGFLGLWRLGDCSILSMYGKFSAAMRSEILRNLYWCKADPSTLKILSRELSNSNPNIKTAAYYSLGKLNQSLDYYQCMDHILDDVRDLQRLELFQCLFDQDPEKVVEIIQNYWDLSLDNQSLIIEAIQCLDACLFLNKHWSLFKQSAILDEGSLLENQPCSTRVLKSLIPFLASIHTG